MKKSGIVTAAIAACLTISACASAPISVAGSVLPSMRDAQNVHQSALRTSVTRLEDTYVEQGWVHRVQSMTSAGGWMNRLTGQSENSDTPIERGVPVAYLVEIPYMISTNTGSLVADASMARLASDLDEADALIRDVNFAAQVLIREPSAVTRASLAEDIEHLERAVGYSRQALDTFNSAMADIAGGLEQSQLAQLETRRARFARDAEALRDRADDIAQLRRTLMTGASS
ncbi:hypothetical protein [Maricaulis sp.]|uniref:hypothetical protein n=1 Tax=Maricaulis sp. TaxID=1486257 RepID=UPI001B27FC22|nr:hypothetical protein [Maricaulis sp.]MBO6796756.1 hypothetical protein [Maricaulis sp.]